MRGKRKAEHCFVWPQLGTCLSSDSNLLPLCTGPLNTCENAPSIGLELQINFGEWTGLQITNPQIRRTESQYIQLGWGACDSISAPSRLYNILSIYWIAIEPSRHMNDYFLHEDFSKNLGWKWIVSFSPQVTPLSWTPATCLSLCLRWGPRCWATGQFYPTLTVLLGSSSSPFVVPLTATSCPPEPMTAVWLCTNPCFMSP